MKKLIALIVSLMLLAVVVEAGCGSCSAAAKDTKKAAVCDVKGTCKAEAAKKSCGAGCEKACCKKDDACEIKKAAEKKACGSDCAKPCCAEKKSIWQKLQFWKK